MILMIFYVQKALDMNDMIMFVGSVFNDKKKCYRQVFLDELLHTFA